MEKQFNTRNPPNLKLPYLRNKLKLFFLLEKLIFVPIVVITLQLDQNSVKVAVLN